ncbi:probable periplasmic serine endoprotease DegP-like [Oppia nitens]|uniref:probable periplasmic serine endoprotease DegP-like n=1 Tax=Oppia nitens TaxID=1686743 RepID=UPI0023DA5CB9|nr:probable periplasmic serine endoprotease DegP-like [Oppia nitens]
MYRYCNRHGLTVITAAAIVVDCHQWSKNIGYKHRDIVCTLDEQQQQQQYGQTVGYQLMKTVHMTNQKYNIDYIFNLTASKFVKVYQPNYQLGLSEGIGTGTVIKYSRQPLIVTNEHVTSGRSIMYIQCNHESNARPGQVVYENHALDLALIWVPSLQFDFMLSDCQPVVDSELEFGDEVISVGFTPFGPTIYMGCGHAVCTDSFGPPADPIVFIPTISYVKHTAGQCPGFSGGPTMNLSGKLVAINCIGREYNQYNYSILAIDLFKNFVEIGGIFMIQQMDKREFQHSLRLGLTLQWTSLSLASGGCLIRDKFCKTLENQDLDTDDIIVGINGQIVRSLDHFMNEITAQTADITVLIKGDKAPHTIQTQLLDIMWI